MAKTLKVDIIGDASSLNRALGSVTKSGSKFGSIMHGAVRAGAIAAGAAFAGLGIAAKIGFDEFNEGQRVAAQTQAVLKSTGGVANVTAKQIDSLATSLMNKTGIDDEAIKSGANLLLTFRDIRNEAGKGNDIFSQATKTVQDMSVALGQDTKASAIQLGKALNDPIRGITALRRVGVSFNDAQTKTITKLVESGKTMEAQKVILAELKKEFGGSAVAAGKTLSGQLNILKETFKNTAGEVIGRFVPVLVQITKAVLPVLLKGLDYAVQGIEFLADAISQVVQGIGFGAFGKRTEDDLGRVGQAAIGVGQVLKRIWEFIKANIVPIILRLKDIAIETFKRFKKVVEDNRPALERIGQRIGSLAKFLVSVLLPVIKVVFQEVLPRVLGIAIKVIDKVTAAIVGIVGAVKDVVKWVKDAYSWIKDKLGSAPVRKSIELLAAPFRTLADIIETIISGIKWIIDHIPSISALNPTRSGNAGVPGGRGGSGAPSGGPGPAPRLQSLSPRLAGVGGVVIENVLTLDGEVIYRNQRRVESRHMRRN